MKAVFVILCAAAIPSLAACAKEPGHEAQGSDQSQKGAAAPAQAAKAARQEVLCSVDVESPDIEDAVETVVACKVQAGKVVDCDPEDMKDPKTGKGVLKEIVDRVWIQKGWKSKLNDDTSKALDRARQKAMVAKLKHLAAKLAYLKAAKKALDEKLAAAPRETAEKMRDGKERLENILNDTASDCVTLHRENFKDSVIDCRATLQSVPPGYGLPPGQGRPPQPEPEPGPELQPAPDMPPPPQEKGLPPPQAKGLPPPRGKGLPPPQPPPRQPPQPQGQDLPPPSQGQP